MEVNTKKQFSRWLRLELEAILEWEAVGYKYQGWDWHDQIDDCRTYALQLELPEIASLCHKCRTSTEAATVLSSCLAALHKSDLVDLAEAAKIVGCSESGMRKLVKRGAIQYVQNGKRGRIRFRREWLNEIAEPEETTRTRKPKVKTANIEARFGFDPALLKL